jgi:hypothetical protein
MVAVEPGPGMALSTGEIRTPEESSGVVAQPQNAGAVAAATSRAAAQGDPNDPSLRPASLKIDMSRLIAGRTSAAVTLGVDKSAAPDRSGRIPIVTNSAQN